MVILYESSLTHGSASVVAFVDGFANLVHQGSYGKDYLPNFVTGDFDSITPETLAFYQSQESVSVIHTPDENETDFTKCLRIVNTFIEEKQVQLESIIAAHISGGRLDHELSLIHTLFLAPRITTVPVYLVSDFCVSLLLYKGETIVNANTGYEGGHVGIIPIGKPSTVTTSGLQWNVYDEVLSFETTVSTCNRIREPMFTVTCDEPVLLTMEYKLPDNTT
ncbi:thiamine pyrophosphokinase 1 [Fasciola hepatica]|uniref:Thiamine pyrophosphokinase 1 n=1 Tax=Fasciola hepatica TaxID=6192 RepID=A0A2H1C271_FASHE|nr:thiamine pyrophosphokinase 1 [Fasciola hepatica]